MSAVSLSYAGVFIGIFLTIGLFLPFWPLWLSSKGLDPQTIGIFLSAGSLLRLVVSPSLARLSDRSGRPKMVMLTLAAFSLVGFSGFFFAEGYWVLLALQILITVSHAPLIPLTDSHAMSAVKRGLLDYGRSRLWGSLAFILASIGGGWYLTGRDPDHLLWLMLAVQLFTLFTLASLPRDKGSKQEEAPPKMKAVLAVPGFLILLGATALLQGSHGFFYGFSALSWQAVGLDKTTIGWLWAVGVLAEVALFYWLGSKVVERIGIRRILLIAGLAGLIRWSLLSLIQDPWLLFPVQTLHAITYAAVHLASIVYISHHAPKGLGATVQTIHGTVIGSLAISGVILVSGWLFEAFGQSGYLVMALLSLCGGLLSQALPARNSKVAE